jgi:acyl-CoA thioesterase
MDTVLELFEKDSFAKGCGIKIIEMKPGYAKCTMEIKDEHLNGLGIAMGGALFTLADFTFSVAANSYVERAVSLNVFISYLKKCNKGLITAIAREISKTNRTGVYNISITNEEGDQVAEVTGTCFFMAERQTKNG